jgi:hypothetical protein
MNRSANPGRTSYSRRRALPISRINPVPFLLTVSIIFAGCEKSAAPETVGEPDSPRISELAVTYTNLVRMRDVFVNPDLAGLCRGVSQEEVAAARTHFGPHANTSIRVFMNPPAADALKNNLIPYPVGSVIVKQKMSLGYQRSDGTAVEGEPGVGGMVKRSPGYDPTHGDWEYFYVEGKSPLESGRLSTCVTCHSSARDRDHVFGTWKNRSPH